jgi:hypothetical protein
MSQWICQRPEWAEDETCPLDTGEYESCAECCYGYDADQDE